MKNNILNRSKKYLTAILLLLLVVNTVNARQSQFITAGTIKFTKTINMFARIKKRLEVDANQLKLQAFEQFKKSQPQFLTQNSVLTFANNKSVYQPLAAAQVTAGVSSFIEDVLLEQINTVYTDLQAGTNTIQKKALDETFLLQEKTRKIKWKITDETREIAGYTCRRANAIVMDSIYVVAFYTDKIMASTGPESFGGLPGMILGLALPHENITWFASSIEIAPIPANSIVAPVKGKAVSGTELSKAIRQGLRFYNEQAAQFYLKSYLL